MNVRGGGGRVKGGGLFVARGVGALQEVTNG